MYSSSSGCRLVGKAIELENQVSWIVSEWDRKQASGSSQNRGNSSSGNSVDRKQ